MGNEKEIDMKRNTYAERIKTLTVEGWHLGGEKERRGKGKEEEEE